MNQTSGVSAELRASIAASIPARCHTTPACPYCDAARDHRCVSATGREVADHRGRTTLKTLMDVVALPVPDEVPILFTTHPGRKCLRLTAPDAVCEGRSIYMEFSGRLPHFHARVSRIPGRERRVLTLNIPTTHLPALVMLVCTEPDTATLARRVGIVLSDLVRDSGGCTVAQQVFAVPFSEGQVLPHLPDGRFEFGGITEPYPGAWPDAAVRGASQGDLTTLWPYLA